MKPRELVSWAFAVSITAGIGIGVLGYFLFMDLKYSNFPRLEALSGSKIPFIQAIIIPAVSAAPASLVVLLLPATRGDLKFSISGVKVHSPAGPILLWAIIFISCCYCDYHGFATFVSRFISVLNEDQIGRKKANALGLPVPLRFIGSR